MSFFFQILLLIASIAYQAYRADQLRKQMRAREEAMKGFEFTVRGRPAPLAVCYGHAAIRGVQTYFYTSKTYTASDPAFSDTSEFFKDGTDYKYINYAMGSSHTDTYNVFLFIDQAICAESATDVTTCYIDDMAVNVDELRYGLAMQVQLTPPVPGDPNPSARQLPLRSNNLPVRQDAWFGGAVNACMVFKLNRDDPQYGGAPDVAFLIKGKKVRDIIYTGTDARVSSYLSAPTEANYTAFLEAAKSIQPNEVQFGAEIYSSNPALVLADYMTRSRYGKQLDDSSLDLVSFLVSKGVCDLTIHNYINDPGPFLDSDRPLRLFEADLMLDTSASVRDNIRKIRDTMYLAESPWSDGKYKLNLSFPFRQEHLEPLSVMTIDDDVILNGRITTIYPGKNERMNSCKVSFLNEVNGGVKDYIVWPPESSDLHKKFLEQDGGKPIIKNIQIEDVTHPVHAKLTAMREVLRSRSLRFYKVSCNIKASVLEPGDIVKLQSDKVTRGGEPVYCRVKEVSFADSSQGLTVTLDMEEVNYEANVIDADAQDLANPGIRPVAPRYAFLSEEQVWVELLPGNAVNDFNVYNRGAILLPAAGDLYHRAYSAPGITKQDDEEFTIIPVTYYGAETDDVRKLLARKSVGGVNVLIGEIGNASASTLSESVVPEQSISTAVKAVVWGKDTGLLVGYEATILANSSGEIVFKRDGKVFKTVHISSGLHSYSGQFSIGNNTTSYKTISMDVKTGSGSAIIKSARIGIRS